MHFFFFFALFFTISIGGGGGKKKTNKKTQKKKPLDECIIFVILEPVPVYHSRRCNIVTGRVHDYYNIMCVRVHKKYSRTRTFFLHLRVIIVIIIV